MGGRIRGALFRRGVVTSGPICRTRRMVSGSLRIDGVAAEFLAERPADRPDQSFSVARGSRKPSANTALLALVWPPPDRGLAFAFQRNGCRVRTPSYQVHVAA